MYRSPATSITRLSRVPDLEVARVSNIRRGARRVRELAGTIYPKGSRVATTTVLWDYSSFPTLTLPFTPEHHPPVKLSLFDQVKANAFATLGGGDYFCPRFEDDDSWRLNMLVSSQAMPFTNSKSSSSCSTEMLQDSRFPSTEIYRRFNGNILQIIDTRMSRALSLTLHDEYIENLIVLSSRHDMKGLIKQSLASLPKGNPLPNTLLVSDEKSLSSPIVFWKNKKRKRSKFHDLLSPVSQGENPSSSNTNFGSGMGDMPSKSTYCCFYDTDKLVKDFDSGDLERKVIEGHSIYICVTVLDDLQDKLRSQDQQVSRLKRLTAYLLNLSGRRPSPLIIESTSDHSNAIAPGHAVGDTKDTRIIRSYFSAIDRRGKEMVFCSNDPILNMRISGADGCTPPVSDLLRELLHDDNNRKSTLRSISPEFLPSLFLQISERVKREKSSLYVDNHPKLNEKGKYSPSPNKPEITLVHALNRYRNKIAHPEKRMSEITNEILNSPDLLNDLDSVLNGPHERFEAWVSKSDLLVKDKATGKLEDIRGSPRQTQTGSPS